MEGKKKICMLVFFIIFHTEQGTFGSLTSNTDQLVRISRSISCHFGYFMCNSSRLCFERNLICDGVEHCEDGSDEWNCNDKLQDEFWNEYFQKRPDYNRDKTLSYCKLSTIVPKCKCTYRSLFCENLGLKNIPNPLPSDVQILDLSGNSINIVSSSSFPHLENLQELVFSKSNVRSLSEHAFYNFPSLKKLYLIGNKLKRITNDTFFGMTELRMLILSYNPLETISTYSFRGLNKLEKLDLRNCELSTLEPNVFKPLRGLRLLWLDNNRFVNFNDSTFSGLVQLEILSFIRNQIINVDGVVFADLIRLQILSLASNSLQYLKPQQFGHMSSLLDLDLQDNKIEKVDENAFMGLSNLKSLNLKRNSLTSIHPLSFRPLTSLKYIYFDSFRMCSYASHVRVCEPRGDGISSVSHLLDNVILRVSVWIVALMACIGNLCVMVGRLLIKDTNRIHSFYIKNLSLADFLMAVYLFIIAGYDVTFRGNYIRYDVDWRQSWQCTLTGVISTVSSEASIFILAIITTDRYLSILYPLNLRRRTFSFAWSCITVIWLLAIFVAVFPVFHLDYFGNEFYGNNGVCLPLRIHHPFSKGWEYSLLLYCGINGLVFLFILYAYVKMSVTISKSKIGLRCSHQQQDRTIAKRFAFIVGTNFMCWFPIIIIKCLAVSGVVINSNLYAWVAVFLLPVNSALNPVLYTLTTKIFKQHLAKIVYTWNVMPIAVVNPAESSGISLSSVVCNGKKTKFNVIGSMPGNKSCDRSISRSSLMSSRSRSSGRTTGPFPSTFIVYQNNYY